jgi:hypothetical protein
MYVDSETSLRWVEVAAVEPAICRSTQAPERSVAGRLLAGRLKAGPELRSAAARAVEGLDNAAVGRVIGLGSFVEHSLGAALGRALATRLIVKPGFEWYACRGAGFHNDAHYDGVLFGAWCIQGPPREVVFARAGLRIAAGEGDWVVFDPFEPHAVLDVGQVVYSRELYLGAAPSVFLGFEIALDNVARALFGIGPVPGEGVELSSRVPVNPETGALS